VAERRRRKTQERRSFSTPPGGMLAVVRWAFVLGHLPSVCLCGHSYKTLYRFGFEIMNYSHRGYNLDKNQFLDMCSVFHSACNVLM